MDNELQTVAAKTYDPVDFSEFAPTSYEQWKEEAIVSLKGGDFARKLLTKTYEGITLEPIYTPQHLAKRRDVDGVPGFGDRKRGARVAGYIGRGWEIAQAADTFCPSEANALLKQELEKGSTVLHIVLASTSRQGKINVTATQTAEERGTFIAVQEDMDRLLDELDLTQYPLYAATGAASSLWLAMLANAAAKQQQPLSALRGCIGADPLGTYAREGELPCSLDALYDEMAHTVAWAEKVQTPIKTILIDGSVYHDAGANAVQELAYTLTTGIEYLHALQIRGIAATDAAKRMKFHYSLGANFFMEIAKLRAARMLWAKIMEGFDGDESVQGMDIHAETAGFTKSVYDPYVNMLRTTTEAFAGVVGGADSMKVGCFDEAIRPADDFSRRIARNIQIFLQNECNLRQPVDPAGGSWYIEELTYQLAERAWGMLQTIEQKGGLAKCLAAGELQKDVSNIRTQRFTQLARRTDRKVGINMYANIEEIKLQPVSQEYKARLAKRLQEINAVTCAVDAQICGQYLDQVSNSISQERGGLVSAVQMALQAGATIEDVRRAMQKDEEKMPPISAFQKHRAVEEFEALREYTEKRNDPDGRKRRIFLANMGPIPQHKARADFTTGFMEVGGFLVSKNDGFADIDAAADAALAANPLAVVICSTDDTYPELVPPLAQKIKASNAAIKVIVAGAPPQDLETVYREAGVDEFIHIRSNCYQVLTWLQQSGDEE